MKWLSLFSFAMIFLILVVSWLRRYLFLAKLHKLLARLSHWKPSEECPDDNYRQFREEVFLLLCTDEKKRWASSIGVDRSAVDWLVQRCHRDFVCCVRSIVEKDFYRAVAMKRNINGWFQRWGKSQNFYHPTDFQNWLEVGEVASLREVSQDLGEIFDIGAELTTGRPITNDLSDRLEEIGKVIDRWPRRRKPDSLDCPTTDLPPETPEDEAETERIGWEVKVVHDRAAAEAERVCAKFTLPGSSPPEVPKNPLAGAAAVELPDEEGKILDRS